MMNKETLLTAVSLWAAAATATGTPAWSGYLAAEFRGYAEQALYEDQDHRQTVSVSAQPEMAVSWDGHKRQIRIVPFIRVDEQDRERSHADIRELSYIHALDGFEWRVGLRKVFWGVTESAHLVDIINQTDLVEGLDGEEKLGQPMLNAAWIRDWGALDIYVLPGFRPRTYAGVNGRLRFDPPVAADAAVYESRDEDRHVDAAVRFARNLGDVDMGFSYFYGTNRDPRLLPGLYDNQIMLLPHYDIIRQAGLDLQLTTGAWLWKWESIYRDSKIEHYSAATGGVEYTLFNVQGTGLDVGVLSEYLYDERGDKAETPFQHDVMLGVRLAFNDTQSSQVLVAVIEDTQNNEQVVTLEASRRISNHWKVNLEGGFFKNVEKSPTLGALRQDDYMQLELAYYF